MLSTIFFNLLYSDGVSHTYWYNKYGMPIVHFKGLLDNDVFLSLKDVLILANSADPDEMQHYATFHQGLACLPKYLLRGLQYTRVKWHICTTRPLAICQYLWNFAEMFPGYKINLAIECHTAKCSNRGYLGIANFLIFPRKHMLWVPRVNNSLRHFQWVP